MSGKEAETKNDPSSRSTSRWMFFALLIAAIVFLVRYIAPQTVGEQVRRHIEQQLRDHYTGLDIHIGRGRFVPDRGLILEDVNFAVPLASRSRVTAIKGLLSPRSRELIHIDQLIVETQTRLERLADKQNPFVAKRMIVRGLSASVWMEADESVSLERLLPMPKLGNAPCPRMEVHDASIVLETDSKQLRPIEIVISEAVALKHRVSLQDPVEDLVLALEESHVPIYQSNIQAKGTASFAETLMLNITTTADSHQVNAKLMGARFSKDLIERLPKRYAELLQPVVGLELLADTELNVSVSPNAPLDFTAETRIRNGSFLHPKSSVPVKDIQGRVTCNSDGVRIETCQAHWGDARLHINGQTYGYSTTPRATLDVRAENVLVDRRLQAIAPPKLASVWNKFEPEGFIDVPQARFEIANGQIQTTAEIECKGVDLSYEKFPYPVQNVSGTMTMRDGRLFSEMISGRVGGQAMRCIFNVPTKAGSVDPRVISITMGGPLAIDNELLQALTPRGEEMTKLETFVRSLTPYGAINLTRATFRTDEEGRKHKDIDLDVSEGSLRYVKFPYPLSNVNGNIRVIDDDVTINEFVAANANGGTIRCSGRYQLSVSDKNGYFVEDRPAGKTLLLDFAASNVAMDESLRSSLPPKSRETWDNLSPSGVLHSLNLSMQQNAHGDELDFNILGQQFDTNRLGTDALRLQPSAVPYRLDITEGMVQYKNGRVSIDAIRAEHGRTAISADGMCEQLPSGQWLLSVNVHSNSRLIPDSELIVALPNELRGALRGLNLRGPVGFRGLTQTLLPDEIHPDPVFAWNDLVLQLEGNRIGDVGPVHALRGELTVSGRRDSQGMRASGEVRIDSMHVNDLQITGIRGPFSIEDDRLRLGSVNRDGSPGNPIGGRLFDGLIRLDGNVKLSDASFNVRLALDEAKVPVVLADLGQGKSDLSGTLGANMTLEGLLGTTDLLQGRGKASVDDANLYQLPVLVQLLNVLSISPTEDVAFTNADMDFTLIEDEIRFDYMNLEGSLIKLEGAGSLDRRQELDLTFNTRVSPRNTFTRIFRPLVDQRYTLWTVDVRGPLDDPSIERRSFDGVGETLERLFPSTGAEAARKDRMAGAGRMMQ